MTETLVKNSARNRALRTLVQGLAFDVAAAVVIVLYTAFSSATGWTDIQWALLGFTLSKTVSVSALSYLMRTVFAGTYPPVEEGSDTPIPFEEG